MYPWFWKWARLVFFAGQTYTLSRILRVVYFLSLFLFTNWLLFSSLSVWKKKPSHHWGRTPNHGQVKKNKTHYIAISSRYHIIRSKTTSCAFRTRGTLVFLCPEEGERERTNVWTIIFLNCLGQNEKCTSFIWKSSIVCS
jgi:hypothetical protein